MRMSDTISFMIRYKNCFKRTIFNVVISVVSCYSLAQSQNIMSEKYTLQELENILISYEEWIPFPKITDRDGWAKADIDMMSAYIKEAERYLNYKWPTVPATTSLLIVRTGNRSEYQSISHEKRTMLGMMLLAEIAENKGRFVDQIIDGVWSVCEESWWGVPAHLPKTKEYSGLMDVENPFVELYAAETGTLLAWIDYFLGDKFDEISPQICKRIYNEVNYRLMQPLMKKNHGWMGKSSNGRAPNNWNPWICSNWINFVLLLEKNTQIRAEMISKSLKVLDEFVNPYPMDGGCNEGPGYWGAAAASLYDNVSLLNLATNDAFGYVFADEKIQNMGKFIYRAQISERYFLNFADSGPSPGMSANMIFCYGKAINDRVMMEFGAFYAKAIPSRTRAHYFRNFFELFNQKEIQETPKRIPLYKNVWLPDLQIMASRDADASDKGFYLAVKGGNNDESHNHNDIGNFVVYFDGQPLIIDIGSGTYTARTFGRGRYDLWFNCSNYHNLPTINGKKQSPGHLYAAGDVAYKVNKTKAELSLDLVNAYNQDAEINSWKRTVRLNRRKNVQITDNYQLKEATQIVEHMMTCYPCEIQKEGEVIINFKKKDGDKKDFVIHYNPMQMRVVIEKVELDAPEDAGVKRNWGEQIYRISFDVINPKLKDVLDFTINVVH